MTSADRIIKNTGLLYAKMGITMLASLYSIRLIINNLGNFDFGIFTIIGGAIALLGFFNATMSSATQRFMSYAEGEGNSEKKKAIFNISFVLHFFLALFVGALLWLIGFFYFDRIFNLPENRIHAAHIVYYSLIVSAMFTIMTVPYEAVLNSRENMLYYSIIGIIESILKLSVAFAVAYTSGDKLIHYGVLMACIPLLSLTAMRFYCHRYYPECTISLKRYFDQKLFNEMTSFSGWQFLFLSTSMAFNYGQGIILNHYWGVLLNTAQGISGQISGQLMAFSNTMLKALNPAITKNEGAGRREMMLHASFMGCKYSYLLFGCFCLPVMFEMKGVLKLWLGTIPDWAILFCRLQLIISLSEQLTISLQSALSAQGDIKHYTLLRASMYLLAITVSFLGYKAGMPPYWLYIVAILFSLIGNSSIIIYFCKIKLKMNFLFYLKTSVLPTLIPTLPVIVLGSLLTYVPSVEILTIITKCIIMFAAFTVFSYFGALSREEQKIIRRMLRYFCDRVFRKKSLSR